MMCTAILVLILVLYYSHKKFMAVCQSDITGGHRKHNYNVFNRRKKLMTPIKTKKQEPFLEIHNFH